MAQPLINGQEFSWASVTPSIAGYFPVGITDINYSDKEEIEGVFGAGNRFIGVARGNVTTAGSITMLLSEVLRLIELSPTGRIQDLPMFDISVSYRAGTTVTTHKLLYCLFPEFDLSVKQNDKTIPVTLPLFIGDIKLK